jgi:hypothetical protein
MRGTGNVSKKAAHALYENGEGIRAANPVDQMNKIKSI